jgi:hypothetical protein
MTKISVFQALTLLAEKYHHDPSNHAKFQQIKYIYLTGVRSSFAQKILEDLLDDPCLTNFEISAAKKDINEDPVRRYFESHLCHNTLAASLDDLDIFLLAENFNFIFELIHKRQQDLLLAIVEEQIFISNINEYSDGISKLNKSTSYQSLSPTETSGKETPEDILRDRKQKLIFIAKSMYAIVIINNQVHPDDLPLDLYNERPSSPFNPINRGREERLDIDLPYDDQEQDVRPHTLGIMRSYMPLPQGDALLAEEPSNYSRPADRYTYMENRYLSSSPHSVPKKMFSNQVTPFVSSISGTMLMQLKIMALLLRRDELPFRAEPGNLRNVQLELYIKSFVSYMLYNAGGHSLDEYLKILNYAVVHEEFEHLVGFSDLTLKNLFQDKNTVAFDKTMEQTIVYNNNIIQKKKLHDEITEQAKAEEEEEEEYLNPFTFVSIQDEEISKLSIFQAPPAEMPVIDARVPKPPTDAPDVKIRKKFNPPAATKVSSDTNQPYGEPMHKFNQSQINNRPAPNADSPVIPPFITAVKSRELSC